MQQGARVCIASLEIKPKKLLGRLTRQAAGLAEPTENYIRAIHEWYEDKGGYLISWVQQSQIACWKCSYMRTNVTASICL